MPNIRSKRVTTTQKYLLQHTSYGGINFAYGVIKNYDLHYLFYRYIFAPKIKQNNQ